MKTKTAIRWKAIERRVREAQVQGNPHKRGSEFVVRYQAKVKLHVPPHWHPCDEHITVLAGKFGVARGRAYDSKQLRPLGPGSYVWIPERQPHFTVYNRGTVVQVHGTGPFKTIYI